MPHRYQAPQHTTGVFAPAGELRADDKGVIEIADDAPQSSHDALRRAGCTQIAADAPESPENGPDGDVSGRAKLKT